MAGETVEAPMMGRVIRVHVENGHEVQEGDPICDIEALKMEIPIVAPVSGRVTAVSVSAGQKVEAGDGLAVIEQ